jgi:hypothetical protein
VKLRRGMVAADGPGWAVTGYDGEPLPGRWPDEATARREGLLGVYLLSGADVVEIPERPVETGDGAWRYKGWTFHRTAGHGHGFAIHGPNSTGRRARKIVTGWSDAVRYIDARTD